MKVRGGTIFATVLLFLFLGGLYLCMDWSVKARLFPLLIVVAGTGLSMWVGLSEISRGREKKKEDKPRKDDLRAALRPAKQKATPKSEAIMMLWVLGFLSMILAFGFWVAIVVFTPLFMPLFGRENWSTVAIYTVGIWLTIYLVFGVCMKVPLYGGILGLSW